MRLLNYTYNREENRMQSLVPTEKQYRDILTSFLDEAEPFDIFIERIKEGYMLKRETCYETYITDGQITGGKITDGIITDAEITDGNITIYITDYDYDSILFEIKEDNFILWSYSISSYIGFYNFQMTLWYKTGITFATYYSFENDYFWYPPFIAERTEWDITGGNYDFYL